MSGKSFIAAIAIMGGDQPDAIPNAAPAVKTVASQSGERLDQGVSSRRFIIHDKQPEPQAPPAARQEAPKEAPIPRRVNTHRNWICACGRSCQCPEPCDCPPLEQVKAAPVRMGSWGRPAQDKFVPSVDSLRGTCLDPNLQKTIRSVTVSPAPVQAYASYPVIQAEMPTSMPSVGFPGSVGGGFGSMSVPMMGGGGCAGGRCR